MQTRTCNTHKCNACFWREFFGGNVVNGISSDDLSTSRCYEDTSVLPLEAQKYLVGMGSGLVENLSPYKTVCGACVLFTTEDGKVGQIILRL